MSNQQNDGFLNAAVVGAAIILFARTADVLSYFSPSILNDIIGSDISLLYGIVTAVMVEGVALALHFNRRAARSTSAQWVKWSLLAISGACQVFDGYIITDSLASQTETIKLVFQIGVPLIPLLIVVMIFWVGKLPEDNEPRKKFVGLKNIPAQFSWIWNGEGAPNAPQPKPALNVNQSQTKAPKIEEDKPKENP